MLSHMAGFAHVPEDFIRTKLSAPKLSSFCERSHKSSSCSLTIKYDKNCYKFSVL